MKEAILTAAAVLLLLGFLSEQLVLAEQPQTPLSTADYPELFRLMETPAWRTRAAALSRLKKDPNWAQSPDARGAVVALQRQEDRRRREARMIGSTSEFSEAYYEYYDSVLIPSTMRVLDVEPAEDVIEALAWARYNPESALAKRLASQGTAVLAIMVRMVQTGEVPNRWNALYVLGEVVRLQNERRLRNALTPQQVNDALRAVRESTLDPESSVRRHAVRALGAARDLEAVPILRRLAESDPDVKDQKAKMDFSVRGEALRALAAIGAQR